MTNADQQIRLQRFWENAVFSLGIFWGLANLVYFPIAALTSIVGSSWFEGFIIIAGGALTFCASIGAFYRRRLAARILVVGGIVLLSLAIVGQSHTADNTHGLANLLLLFLAGIVALSLGIFGWITDLKDWPALRATHQLQQGPSRRGAAR